ncbi:MAG: glycosyltransferase, partial [Chitinophagaceae bacterium]
MSPAATISVISICFNNLAELIATMESVDKQTLLPFEHIIIDGSTNTAISDYLTVNTQPGYRKWICENDKGIADAFNKGVKLATGRVLNMLNSGDRYINEVVLQTVDEKFEQDPDLAWLHGKFLIQRGGLWVTIGKPFNPGLLYRGMRSLSHQSMFLKSSLHDKFGLYDVTLRNAMDYDFVCRIAGEKFIFIQQPLIVFAPGGTTD